jgi:hypothetical protein
LKKKIRISDSELAIAREKVVRAYKHFQVAARMIRRFARNDCGVDSKFNPKTGEFEVIARMPDPPPIIGLLIGDCVHNLRSALDHIVYALIATNPLRGGAPPSDKAMFPICSGRAEYRRQTDKLKRLEGIPDAVAALIETLQPYHTREKGLDHTLHPLWVLNKLDNIDKHRRLTLASGVARHAHVSIRYRDGGESDVVLLQDMIHDRAILTSYLPAPDGSEVQMDGGLMVYVALHEADELPSLLNEEIASVLVKIIEYVGNVLLPRFRRLATGHKPTPKRSRRQDKRPKLRGKPTGL